MNGQARKITVTRGELFLEWLRGEEPTITTVEGVMDPIVRSVQAPELAAVAERVLQAALSVLDKSPIEQTMLRYNLDTRTLKGGCWWTVAGGPHLSEFKPEMLAQIAERI